MIKIGNPFRTTMCWVEQSASIFHKQVVSQLAFSCQQRPDIPLCYTQLKATSASHGLCYKPAPLSYEVPQSWSSAPPGVVVSWTPHIVAPHGPVEMMNLLAEYDFCGLNAESPAQTKADCEVNP